MSSKGRGYRTFRIDGFEVLVGRSDRDNEVLTFEVAAPGDVWLHVAGGTPGSHVLVRNPERLSVPPGVLERAAAVAAWHSKARGAPRVDVHYCLASQVRKPRGAPLGSVEIARYRTLRVKPELPEAESD